MNTSLNWLSRIVVALAVGLGLFACGGGGGGDEPTTPTLPSTTRTLTVVPALGGFSAGATVSLINPAGGVLGSATTDANGAASPVIGSYTGPFIVRVSGGPGVTFFNEKTGGQDAFGASARLLAVVPGLPASASAPQVGVTPITNAAAAVIVANPDNPSISGSNTQAIVQSIATANARIQTAVGLDPSFSILAAPRVLRSASDTLNSTDAVSLRYGALLTALALASTSNDLLAAANGLAADARTNSGALPASAAILTAASNQLGSVIQRFVPAAQQASVVSFVGSVRPDPSLSSPGAQAAIAAAAGNYVSSSGSSSSASSASSTSSVSSSASSTSSVSSSASSASSASSSASSASSASSSASSASSASSSASSASSSSSSASSASSSSSSSSSSSASSQQSDSSSSSSAASTETQYCRTDPQYGSTSYKSLGTGTAATGTGSTTATGSFAGAPAGTVFVIVTGAATGTGVNTAIFCGP